MRRTAGAVSRARSGQWGRQHTPVIIAYGNRASNGTPMIAVGGVSLWCSGGGYREVRSSGGGGGPGAIPSELHIKGAMPKRTELLSHKFCRPAVIILGVAQHHTFIRTAQSAASAPPFAATIARAHRRWPPHPHSDRQRDNGPQASLPASPSAVKAASRSGYTSFAGCTHSQVAITRYDALTTRPTITHDNTTEVPAARANDAVELIHCLACDPGVSGL